jgi:hypothetical protein
MYIVRTVESVSEFVGFNVTPYIVPPTVCHHIVMAVNLRSHIIGVGSVVLFTGTDIIGRPF